jgi:NADH:ubiquinone oxidoreductase subunit 4 (subunit M)
LKDINNREMTILVLIVFFVLLMGLYSQMFFKKMDVSAAAYLENLQAKVSIADTSGEKVQ